MGYLFLRPSALGLICSPSVDPLAPKILSLQFQGTDWYDRDEVLRFSTKNVVTSKIQYTLSTEEFFVSRLHKVHFPPWHLSAPASA